MSTGTGSIDVGSVEAARFVSTTKGETSVGSVEGVRSACMEKSSLGARSVEGVRCVPTVSRGQIHDKVDLDMTDIV